MSDLGEMLRAQAEAINRAYARGLEEGYRTGHRDGYNQGIEQAKKVMDKAFAPQEHGS